LLIPLANKVEGISHWHELGNIGPDPVTGRALLGAYIGMPQYTPKVTLPVGGSGLNAWFLCPHEATSQTALIHSAVLPQLVLMTNR